MCEESPASDDVAAQTLQRDFAAMETLDPQMIASALLEFGELEDPVGTDVVRGRDHDNWCVLIDRCPDEASRRSARSGTDCGGVRRTWC